VIPGVDNATPHMLPLGRRLFDIGRLADVDGQFCLGPVMMESQSVSHSIWRLLLGTTGESWERH